MKHKNGKPSVSTENKSNVYVGSCFCRPFFQECQTLFGADQPKMSASLQEFQLLNPFNSSTLINIRAFSTFIKSACPYIYKCIYIYIAPIRIT